MLSMDFAYKNKKKKNENLLNLFQPQITSRFYYYKTQPKSK